MNAGQEQAWAAGSRHSAWTLPDVLRANSSRRGMGRTSSHSEQPEEQMDDQEQLVNAAQEGFSASRRSMVYRAASLTGFIG